MGTVRSARFFCSAAVLIIAISFSGCGGGGGGGGSADSTTGTGGETQPGIQYTPASVPGTVHLPDGAAYGPDTLQVLTARGVSPVAQDGSFEALGLQEGPVLIIAETSEGTPLLFGWTGDDRGLSVRTTAEVLVFYAAGLFSLPPETLDTVLQALKATTEIDSLAGVIATEIAANPEAFAGKNEAIAKALKDLLAAFAADKTAAPGSAGTGSEQSGLAVNMLSQAVPAIDAASQGGGLLGDLINAVLVNPADEQSGLTANIATGINMFEIANRFIRPAYGYLEQTGYRNASDQQEVQEYKDIREFEIQSVKGFSGVVGTLWDLISGQQQAFAQVTTGPFELPMAGGADKTHFRLTIVGPGTGAGQPMNDKQTEKYKELCADYVVTQLVIPILANVLVPYSPLSQKQLTTLLTADNVLQDFLGVINSTVPELWTAIENHDLNAAMTAVMNAIATSNEFRQALVNVVLKTLDQQVFASASTMASHMFSAITAVDALGTIVSSILTTGNVYLAYPCDVWTLDATTPKVKLLPLEQDVATDDYCWFEAGVPDLSGTLPAGTVLHYIWSTSGSFGQLVNPDGGGQAASFETTYSKVSYLAGKNEGTDTISVEAVLVQGTARESLGTATASVHVKTMRKCENRSYNFKYENKGKYGYAFTVLYVWHHREGEYSYEIRVLPDVLVMTTDYDSAISNHNVKMPTLGVPGPPMSYFNLADDELAVGGGGVFGEFDTPELRDIYYDEQSDYGQAKIAEAMAYVYWVTPL